MPSVGQCLGGTILALKGARYSAARESTIVYESIREYASSSTTIYSSCLECYSRRAREKAI